MSRANAEAPQLQDLKSEAVPAAPGLPTLAEDVLQTHSFGGSFVPGTAASFCTGLYRPA